MAAAEHASSSSSSRVLDLFSRSSKRGAGEDEEAMDGSEYVKVCAPMVRYSKLAFRLLCRKYGADLCFTPMIMADSFVRSPKARDNEFTTTTATPTTTASFSRGTCPSTCCVHSQTWDDRPLVVQFAANQVRTFVEASELVAGHCDGVDLNCGCPQRWAAQEGVGACLLDKPDLVADLVKQTRNRCGEKLSVSVKVRLHRDLAKTVELCRRVQAAGATFVTVHGRRRDQKSSQPVDLAAVRTVKQSLRIPVLVNGDVVSIDSANFAIRETGADGVMAARGLLENPAMFRGFPSTPKECVEDWVNIALLTGTPFPTFHHHLIYMLGGAMSRSERRHFNTLGSAASVLEYLDQSYGVSLDTGCLCAP